MAEDGGTMHERVDVAISPWAFLPWLVVASGSVLDVASGRTRPVVPAVVTLVAGVALFALAVRFGLDERPARVRGAKALLVPLTVLVTVGNLAFAGHLLSMFLLAAIAAGAVLGLDRPRTSGLALLGLTAVTAAVTRHVGGDAVSLATGTLLSGWGIVIFRRLLRAVAELRQAREELARAAVAQERLRFARDLHDLLGHTLSVIVVKAEVVRRLGGHDPQEAARHAADIEAMGRDALHEIRTAVSGYRGAGLGEELTRAHRALQDAGMDTVVLQTGPPLPPAADAVLGWAVREGTTNVIRHSDASRCTIRVERLGRQAVLELTDDGKAAPGTAAPGPGGNGPGGNGLLGLRERVEAAGGNLETAPRPGGGYRLRLTLPVDETATATQVQP